MKLEEMCEMAPPECAGKHIRIEGKVLDGDGDGVEDAMIEVWQANASGRYRHPADAWEDATLDEAFTGYGRVHTDFASGAYSIRTIKPGSVFGPDGREQAPHLNLIITARGMLNHLFTRLYFDDEPTANEIDPVLQSVSPERRGTLVAESVDRENATYRFDIRLQGDDETVFFDV